MDVAHIIAFPDSGFSFRGESRLRLFSGRLMPAVHVEDFLGLNRSAKWRRDLAPGRQVVRRYWLLRLEAVLMECSLSEDQIQSNYSLGEHLAKAKEHVKIEIRGSIRKFGEGSGRNHLDSVIVK